MTRRVITTNSFEAVAPGNRATLQLPVGPLTYHAILLNYGTATVGGPTRANMEAEITQIRLKIEGKTQREMSAAELFALNEVNGITVADGFLPIFLSEPWRRSVNGEEVLAWGTNDIPDLFVEVDIAGGAASPTLAARIAVDDLSRNLGFIKKIKRHTINVTATGIRNVTTLPKSDAYYRLHAFSTNILDIEINVDGQERWKLTDAQARELYAEHGLSVPATLTSVIFDHTQRAADTLAMRNDLGNGRVREVGEFRVDYNMGVATTFSLVTETLGPRD